MLVIAKTFVYLLIYFNIIDSTFLPVSALIMKFTNFAQKSCVIAFAKTIKNLSRRVLKPKFLT